MEFHCRSYHIALHAVRCEAVPGFQMMALMKPIPEDNVLIKNTPRLPTWEVVRIQVVSSRLLQVQKIRENDRK